MVAVVTVPFVMMLALFGFIQIFFRVLLEGPLAARGAKIVGFAFVFHASGRLSRVNFHTTYGVYCHG